MKVFEKMFGVKVPVIGVIHLRPLPGAPLYDGASVREISEKAVSDAKVMADNGVNGLIIENFGDKLFQKTVGPETVAAMTYISKDIKDEVDVPIGLCVLQSDAISSIAIAKAVQGAFVRVPYYTETSVVDAGTMESIAAATLRYRKFLDANVKIFADVHIKHSYPLMQRPIEYAAEDSFHRGLADAIIITGRKTGGNTDPDDIRRVREALPEVPLVVGSGVNEENVENYISMVDAIIIATGLNYAGKVEAGPDPERVRNFMKKMKELRKKSENYPVLFE